MRTVLVLVLAALPGAARPASPPGPNPLGPGSAPSLGEPGHGARLYRLHCHACHGPSGRGDGHLARQIDPPPANLRSPALHLMRTADDLVAAIVGGGRAVQRAHRMPAFGRPLSTLDTWDVVALLRQGQLFIDDFFPEAPRYTAKAYTIDDDGVSRTTRVLGSALSAAERRVEVAAVFGTGRPAGAAAAFVPDDPILLDTLRPKDKVGYLAVFEVPAPGILPPAPKRTPPKKGKGAAEDDADPFAWPWTMVPLGIGLDRAGAITTVVLGGDPDARQKAAKALAAFVGQGGKRGPKNPEYKPLKPGRDGGPALGKSLTRYYYRALEGALMFDKAERERTWADPDTQ